MVTCIRLRINQPRLVRGNSTLRGRKHLRMRSCGVSVLKDPYCLWRLANILRADHNGA